eukprot:GHVR01106075.1.p1 GENE.GHVR01106075.1~~GHVR01106075.1.p1  ORF type:complete len:146 (-),score=14.16 GHVR01106075.1:197-634(-)
MGHDGLNNMLAAYEDKSGYAQCIFSYFDGVEEKPRTFIGRVQASLFVLFLYFVPYIYVYICFLQGKIVPPRGGSQFGWDPIFEVDGTGKTFAEMERDEKNSISHRKKSLELLKAYMLENVERIRKEFNKENVTTNAKRKADALKS